MMLVIGISGLAAAEQPVAVRVSERELWSAIDLERPGLSALKRAVAAEDPNAAAAAWAEYFAARTSPTCHFDRRKWPGYIRRELPAVGDAILEKAQCVAAGDLSHATIRLPDEGNVPGGRIDWLHNPGKDTRVISRWPPSWGWG